MKNPHMGCFTGLYPTGGNENEQGQPQAIPCNTRPHEGLMPVWCLLK